jgi:DNA-binding CsgD family transcriptional regulator
MLTPRERDVLALMAEGRSADRHAAPDSAARRR